MNEPLPGPDFGVPDFGVPDFGCGALRLSGLSARALGWRPAEFWDATPAELAAAIADPASEFLPVSRNEIDLLLEREHDG